MIYITGDTHGDIVRFIENNMGDSEWTQRDTLIICGDFGFVFNESEFTAEKLDYLGRKPYNICFCDGNHENFQLLFEYPEEEWNGGRVHRIRDNIFHLMRGQIFSIEGRKFFTFGGAYSIDRYMRKLGVSYWDEEIPNDEDFKKATNNLKKHDFAVDYIITHTAPREIILRMGFAPDGHDMELTGFLEWIMYKADFKKWFFGHWHTDKEITDKITAVYYKVIALK